VTRAERRQKRLREREEREAERRQYEARLAASPDRHPDLRDRGFLAEADGLLVALCPVSGGVELVTDAATEPTLVPAAQIKLGRPGRLTLAPAGARKRRLRLLGANDHRDKRVGGNISLGLGAVGTGGSDPISAVLGLIELAALIVFGPPAVLRRRRRRQRGREEWPRLTREIEGASSEARTTADPRALRARE